jgi:aryl-alcohol dehydrogenase-like predicted oxidoreductase
MDYVDLYQIHRFDYDTPIEETLEALHDVVKAGKARYIGASSMWAWQFMQALAFQKANGWSRFVSMQNHLNLLYREEEREMLPLCRDQGIGVIPWSPLARGRLAREPYDAMTGASRDGPLRQVPLQAHRRRRPPRDRSRRRDRSGARSAARADCAGVAAREGGRHRAHRGRHEDRAIERFDCGA